MQSPYLKAGLFFPLATTLLVLLSACDFSGGETAETHLNRAREFVAANETDSAVIELKNALQKDNNLPEARWMLGRIYLQAGQGAAAFKELNQARSLGFSDPELDALLLQAMLLQGKNQDVLDQTYSSDDMSTETLILRGNAFVGLQQYDEARAAFQEALDTDRDSLAARKGLIRVELARRDLATAEQHLEEALSFALEDPEIWVLKGQLAFLQNQPEEAESAFRKALLYNESNFAAQFGLARALLLQENIGGAQEAVSAVEKKYPQHPLVKFYRGYIALQREDMEKAKVLLQEVISVLPDHAETLLLLSRIHYDEGQLQQAKGYLTDVLAKYPGHLPATKLLSAIELRLEQPGATIRLLNDAVSHAQGDWQVLALLGSALLENGNLEKGIEMLEQAAQVNPETADLHTRLAIGHLASGSVDSAITELESVIELEPEFLRSDILLILTLLKAENYERAITAAMDFIEKHPNNPISYNLLGAAFLRNNNIIGAKEQFEKALSVKADFTPAIANLGRIELQNNNIDAAEKIFREIIEIDANNTDALVNLGYIADQRGDEQLTGELLERARANNPAALIPRIFLGRFYIKKQNSEASLAVINEARDIAPNHPEVLLLLGQAQRLNGQAEKSIATLGTLLEKAPNSTEVRLQIALGQLQTGNIEAARTNLNKILGQDENHTRALGALARLAILEKDFNLARQHISKIAENKEGRAEAHILEGDLQNAQGNHKEAVLHYQKALDLLPHSAIIIKIAQSHDASGNREKARSILEDWLKTHPGDATASLFLGNLIHRTSGDEQQVIEKYEKALESNPDNVIALNNLALAYLEINPERALKLARRAHELVPNRPEIMDTLGWVLVQQDNIEEGLSYLEPARKNADIPDIRYHYAAGLKAAGDRKRALDEVTSLLEAHAFFDTREEAEKLATELQ